MKTSSEPDLVAEVEALLAHPDVAQWAGSNVRELLRRLVEEVRRLRGPIPAATSRCVRCGRNVGRLCNKCAKEPSSVF